MLTVLVHSLCIRATRAEDRIPTQQINPDIKSPSTYQSKRLEFMDQRNPHQPSDRSLSYPSSHTYTSTTVYLFGGVKSNQTSNEGEGDEGKSCEGNGQLILIAHLVQITGEVFVRFVISGNLLGFLAFTKHMKGGSGWERALGNRPNGGSGRRKGTDRRR